MSVIMEGAKDGFGFMTYRPFAKGVGWGKGARF